MKEIHHCRAKVEQRKIWTNQVHFGKGIHAFKMDAKDALRWYDRLIALFFGAQWTALTVRDSNSLQSKKIYVSASQMAAFLGTSKDKVSNLGQVELAKKFYETKNTKKERWVKQSRKLQSTLAARNLNPQTLDKLCKEIEANKFKWAETLRASGESTLEISKSAALPYSVHLKKSDKSDDIKIFIDLDTQIDTLFVPGIAFTDAVDYEQMRVNVRAKSILDRDAAIADIQKVFSCSPEEAAHLFSLIDPATHIMHDSNSVALIKNEIALVRANGLVQRKYSDFAHLLRTDNPNANINEKSLKALTRYIEENKQDWISKMTASGSNFRKIKKPLNQQYSIYLVKKYKSPEIKIFLKSKNQIVGEGTYKVVSKTIDYDKMKLKACSRSIVPIYHSFLMDQTKKEIDLLRTLPKSSVLLLTRYTGQIPKVSSIKFYIFMNYYPLGDLEKQIDEDALRPEEHKQVMKDMLEAAKILHDNGKAHQDLKTDNILLAKDKVSGVKRSITCDFGMIDDIASTCVEFMGNRLYAPPAKLRGVYDRVHVDIYSLGRIFFEMRYGDLYSDIGEKCIIGGDDALANAWEDTYRKQLPYATGKLDKLLFEMMNPDPKLCPSLSVMIESFNQLSDADFAVDPDVKARFERA